MKDLASLTVGELKAIAKKKKIAVPSRLKKKDLIALLVKAEAGAAGGKRKPTAKKTKATPKKTTKRAVPAAPTRAEKTAGTTSKAIAGKVKIKKATAAKAKRAGQKVAVKTRTITAGTKRAVPAAAGNVPPKKTARSAKKAQAAKGGEFNGEERITLMPRDPDTAFAYWESSKLPAGREEAAKESELCIRVYDMGDGGVKSAGQEAYFEQPVSEKIGSAYLEIERPGHTIRAELGLLSPKGTFHSLAGSDPVLMPVEPALVSTEPGSGLPEGGPAAPADGSSMPVDSISMLFPGIEDLSNRRKAISLSSADLARGKRTPTGK